MEKLITIFTPTYNRANILPRCYDCLRKQTSKNFKWLIIDDGSSDDTEKLVKDWINNEEKFEITYKYKENGGLHTAYNEAMKYLNTDVFVCLESDDIFTTDAICEIENIWETIKEPEYVGAITLCIDKDGHLIGEEYPTEIESVLFREHRSIAQGDKQYIFKSEIIKKILPMPVFSGEKYFDPNYQFYKLDNYGKLFVKNIAFDIVDYQKGGLTDTIIKQYYNSPNSFAEFRKLHLLLPNKSKVYKIKESIHYVSSCVLAGKLDKAVQESPEKIYTILSIFPGILLARYIRWKNKRLH